MNSSKSFVVAGLLLSSALLSLNTQAQILVDVSAGNNPAGIFGFLTQPEWISGDISLPAGTVIDSTPLQVDIRLSGNDRLNNAPSGSEPLSYGLWFGHTEDTQLPAGVDGGTVEIELLENGIVITPKFGFGMGTFPFPILGYWTREEYFNLPNNLEFNGVDAFITDSALNGVTVTDFEVALPIATSVPDTANTLSLLFLGVAAMLGFGHRKVISFRSQS